MDHVIGLKCVLCGAEYAPGEVLYVCPKHGDEGILDVVYDYDLVRRRARACRPAATAPSGATSLCCRCTPRALCHRSP
jgi:threonine synthase